jgi:hypothetical protein
MEQRLSDMAPRPAIWRMVLVYCLFVAIGGGIMLLLGQPPMWPVFAGVGLVLVLGARKRWERSQQRTLT